MSKLSDYSKFDHLDDNDDDSDSSKEQNVSSAPAVIHQSQQVQESAATTRKDPDTGRYVFEYAGTKIYEWEQTLEGAIIWFGVDFALAVF